jgi:hypothetical protein
MTAQVDTSAEAVLLRLRKLDKAVVSGKHYGFQQDIWSASAGVIESLQQRIADLESLLATRNEANAAAFTASDAYQKRCEQGDALLRGSLAALTFVHMEVLDGQEGVTSQLLAQIRAHLAGDDMGRKL